MQSRWGRFIGAALAAGGLFVGGSAPWGAPAAKVHWTDVDGQLIEATVSLADRGATLLRPEYVRAQLQRRHADPAVGRAFRAARATLGPERRSVPLDQRLAAAAPLLRVLERRFIHDPNMSSLDLLPREERDRYVRFGWHKDDFPGGPAGPHEDVADAMVDALIRIRPERRANSTENAVVLRADIERTGWEWVLAMQKPLPGQDNRKLHREAVDAYARMRAAAQRDGVTLWAVSANRDPRVAARNAARAANPNAVASFSAHSLGLAVDFRMSQGRQNFDEVSTGDMPGLVRMRTSPVHKWLFLRGALYGWYPYMQEPWHWEYNPIGFRERFWAPQGGPPASG